MSYCINPNCQQRQNDDNSHQCQACNNKLLIKGRYRLVKPLRKLNASPYFEIFEVNDQQGCTKVLKILKTNQFQKYVELFEQEANILINLRHPGIPKGEPDGYFIWELNNGLELRCLVMEKIEGLSLEQWLRKYQQIYDDYLAIAWLRQIIAILDYVHYNDFFHRDIKPSNIMLKPDGRLVLIDFGTAREMTETVVLGQDVTVVLSHGYTPQEQLEGKANKQSDFFALGRTFVHLLTGESPINFSYDSNTSQLIWRDRTQNVSEQLASLIDDLMAPSVENRLVNTQIILLRLEEIGRNLSQSRTQTLPPYQPTSSQRTRLYRWCLIVGLPIALIAGTFFGWAIAPKRLANLAQPCKASTAEDVSAINFSPNGQFLATASLDNTVRVLEITDSNKQVACKEHFDGVVAVKFSVDGRKIATATLDAIAGLGNINSNGRIYKFKSLQHQSPVVAVNFNRDGKYLATATASGTVQVWDTTNARTIADLKHNNYVQAVSFSPDGKYLATASLNSKALVWDWQAHKNGQKSISLPQDEVVAIAFHPTDSKYLATVSADGTAQVWDITRGEKVASLQHGTYLTSVSFSPGGNYLAIANLKNEVTIWEWSADKKGEKPTLLPEDNIIAFTLSPQNGNYLATASTDGSVKIWTNKGNSIISLQENNNLAAIAFKPTDDKYLAIALDDGKVYVKKWK